MELLRELYTFSEIIWDDGDYELTSTINEGIATIEYGRTQAASQKIANKATRGNKLFKKHKQLGIPNSFDSSALINYNLNRKYMLRFFAKTAFERKFYNQMIKDLLKSPEYKQYKKIWKDGGIEWTIRRKIF